MPRKFWLPASLLEQIALLQNFMAKIEIVGPALGWTPAQITAAQELCAQLIAAYNFAESSRSSMQAVTQWRDLIWNGEPMGTAAGSPPTFGVAEALPYTRGSMQQFMQLRDQIVANSAYTSAIGEDLGIIGPEITPKPPSEVSPSLKISVTSGTDTVSVGGSMQGMSAMQITYTPNGGTTRQVAFITSTPAEIVIAKDNPLAPENGTLQAQFYKKNEPYGNPSAVYPITLG